MSFNLSLETCMFLRPVEPRYLTPDGNKKSAEIKNVH